MNTRLLQYFLAVASSMSFSRASENLHVAQSTLSQQIQQLEEYYGAPLFDRTGKTIALTPAGLFLKKEASELLEKNDAIRRRMEEIARKDCLEYYPLRIFFDKHFTHDASLVQAFTEALHTLEQRYRDRASIQVSFLTQDLDGPENHLDDLLENNQIDYWLLGGESLIRHPGMNFTTISEDRFVLSISRYHPLYRDDLGLDDIPYLLNHTELLLLQGRSKFISHFLNSFVGQEVEPVLRFKETADEISLYNSLGKGVSILPGSAVDKVAFSKTHWIELPDSHFYTVAGYRKDSANPLLPELTAQFQLNAASHDAARK